MKIKKWKLPSYHHRGLSLLELLVGMMVGMMVVYGTIKIYAVSDGRNRSVGSKNSTQMAVSTAAHALERDIILAGRGFSHFTSDSILGCAVEVYNEKAAPVSNQFPLIPAYIKDGDDGPDEIHVFYGNSPIRVIPEIVDDSTATTKEVANKGGFLRGDKALLIKEGDSIAKSLCQIVEITDREENDGQAVTILEHAQKNDYSSDYAKGLKKSTMNNPAGTGVNDFTDGYIFSLGPAPVLHRWSVQGDLLNSALFKQNMLPHEAGDDEKKEVTLDIIDLQAQYGYYSGNCNEMQWLEPGAIADDMMAWRNVVAVRFALLARDAHYRPAPYQAKNPVWAGGPFNMPSTGVEWHRYSYEVREVVVPLRNYIKQWREEDGDGSDKC